MPVSRVNDVLKFFRRRSEAVSLTDLSAEVITAFEAPTPQVSTFVGMISAFAMPTPPQGWLICDGRNDYLSTEYSELYSALKLVKSANATSGTSVITVDSTTYIGVGMGVSGANIPEFTEVVSIDSLTQFTISNSVTADLVNQDINIHYWGIGDSDLTFKVPDLRGEFLRGMDMGTGRDPDAGVRAGGYGIGSNQDYAIQRHKHKTQSAVVYSNGGASANRSSASETGGTWWTSGPFDQLTGSFIGKNETRPRNVYVQYCIKY